MKMDGRAAFDELLDPIDQAFFFEEVYERRPLLVRRGNAGFYSDVFRVSDLDSILKSPATASKFLRMHHMGKEIPASKWARGENIDADAVCTLFVRGATMIINSANRLLPRLGRFCNGIERQMHFAVQPNIYVTPATSRGFDTHYVDHDVFIMQVEGSKHWRMYGAPIELPSFGQKHEWGKYASMPPKEDFFIQAGDLLYIPRGHLHDARTTNQASTHITLGLHPPYLYELAVELARGSQQVPQFRRAVPGPMARMGSDEFAASFRQQMHALVDRADIAELLIALDRHFVSKRNPGRQTSFRELLSLPAVDEATWVAASPSVLYRLDRQNGEVHLLLPGTTLKFPCFMEEALRNLLTSPPLRVGDITGLFDQNGKIALVKQLIAAGLLEFRNSPD